MKKPIYYLNIHCKGIMKRYYRWRYKKDIDEMLMLFYEYRTISIKQEDAIKIFTLSKEGRTIEYSNKIFGMLAYLGFIALE